MHPTIELFTARYLNVDADAALADAVRLMCEVVLLSFKYNDHRRPTLGFELVVPVSIGASIRILCFMACAHLCDNSDVLECRE